MLVIWAAPVVNAQDEPEEDVSYAYGTVVSASEESVVALVYDYDLEKEISQTFMITPDTDLYEIATPEELVADDIVEIDFIEDDGNFIAIAVAKEIETEDIDEPEVDEDEEVDTTQE
ncbi:MAG: hypothetical protein KKH94_05490 [Candidatus Omnitrophica bacterium]|nr:hypothetical protein [Candidatus Omnitrophota bacterium]